MAELKKILIVEDDKDTQMFLSMFPWVKNLLYHFADSEVGFYENLSKSKYDLIIMDISIKGKKDGLQLTSELKTSPEYKFIPIICLSAHVLERDKGNAYDAGVDYFLEKPVGNNLLLSKIEELIGK